MHTTSQLLRLYLTLCETLSDLHTFSLMNFSLLLQSDHVVLCLNLIIWKAFNQETSNDIPTQNYIFFFIELLSIKILGLHTLCCYPLQQRHLWITLWHKHPFPKMLIITAPIFQWSVWTAKTFCFLLLIIFCFY